jgi:diguanylate cyclase (GGDEF)-like protein/PAS domain S-box-containing protein
MGTEGIGKNATQVPDANEALRRCEERLKSVLELSSDWYWEQDENLRFTHFSGRNFGDAGFESAAVIGKTRWEIPGAHVGLAEQASVQARMDAREPFRDLEYRRMGADGRVRHISASGSPVFDESGAFKGYRGVAKDVTERKRAEQLQALEHAVNRSLAEAHDAAGAPAAAIRAVCETEGWECGRYFRVDDAAGVLRFEESWGVPEPAIQQFLERSNKLSHETVYKPGVGLVGQVWQSGLPLWVADVSNDPRVLQAAFTADDAIHGGFVFPVKLEGKTIGVLSFSSREVREPEQRLLETIHVIGSQIGQYLQRKEAEEKQFRFRAAMDASADLIFLVDPVSIRYIDVNDAACRALGYSREELLAMGPQDIFSTSREELALRYEQIFASDQSALRIEGVYRCKDGSQLPVEAYPRALRSARGDIIVSISRDIRERKRAEQLLLLEHAVNRSLAEAENASAAVVAAIRTVCENDHWESGGYWHVDQEAGVLRTSDYWCAPRSITEGFFQESRKMTFGPGVGMVGHVWQSAQPLWVADANKDPHVLQTALVRETGIGSVCLFPIMSEGRIIGVLGFVSREIRERDERLLAAVRVIGSQIGQIVQRKLAETALRMSEERFRSLTQLSSDSYWELDDQYRFTLFVGTGLPPADSQTIQLIGKKSWEQDCVNMSADEWSAHSAILHAHAPFHELELCRLGKSDKKFWTSISGEPVFDASGSFKGYRGVGKDITVRKQSEEHIQHLANHDALTSLPNRTMFGEVLNIALKNARRYRRHFALLFIDLDHFKVINDTLGHEAGDELLQEVGRRLTQTVRTADTVARLGGDEFVVLVQEVSEAQQVETVARKILSALTKPMFIHGQECRVTASIGICMYPANAQDERELMKNADIAMYRAKEAGKNAYKFYAKDNDSR